MAWTQLTGRNADALSLSPTEPSKALLWGPGNLEPDWDRVGTNCCVLSLLGQPQWREMRGGCELCPRAGAQFIGSGLYIVTQDDMGPIEYDSCSGLASLSLATGETSNEEFKQNFGRGRIVRTVCLRRHLENLPHVKKRVQRNSCSLNTPGEPVLGW